MAEYTPSDEQVRQSYVHGETVDGEGAVWDDLVPGAQEDFTRWLAAHDARVRRDAAREALDGLVGALNISVHEIQNGPNPNPVEWQTGALWTRDLGKIHRDTHYPEETP